jgi:hypothetical protein
VTMHPLVRGAPVIALLSLLGSPVARPLRAPPPGMDAAGAPSGSAATPCGQLALPLGNDRAGCVPLPHGSELPSGRERSARQRRLALVPDSSGFVHRYAEPEVVPRLPGRPEKFADYQLPVDPVLYVTAPLTSEGMDQAAAQNGAGIEIDTEPNTPVTLIDLENQIDRPRVELVGQLHGITVIVHYEVSHQGGKRDYFLVYGNLSRPGPEIVNGATLSPMAVIGYVGEKDADEAYLYLEVRQQRSPLHEPAQYLSQLVSTGISIPVDPRNVLPLRK